MRSWWLYQVWKTIPARPCQRRRNSQRDSVHTFHYPPLTALWSTQTTFAEQNIISLFYNNLIWSFINLLFFKFLLKAKTRTRKKMRDSLKLSSRFSCLRKVEFGCTMVCNCHIVCQVRSHHNLKYIYRILDLVGLSDYGYSHILRLSSKKLKQ